MRYAIYFTPPRDHPLTRAASSWLGRDAFSGLTLPHAERTGLALGELAYFTAVPRRYGFHGTLKAPFRLSEDFTEDDLVAAAEAFSGQVQPVTIDRVTVARLGGFFAIVPETANPELNDFASQVVAIFDRLNSIRRSVTWGAVQRQTPKPSRDHGSFNEHRRIAEAIANHDPDAAQALMRAHLRRVYHAAVRLTGIESDANGPTAVCWVDRAGRARSTPRIESTQSLM